MPKIYDGPMTHSATKKAKARNSWASLPAKIRLMILEGISGQKYPGWASCAAVCKERQMFLEPKNFHRLTLQEPCLDELEYMVNRSKLLVKYIYLNLDTIQGPCYCFSGSEGDLVFRRTMLKLFSILKTWQPTGSLILEINVLSPSDEEHSSTNLHSQNDSESLQTMQMVSRLFIDLPELFPIVRAVTGLVLHKAFCRWIDVADEDIELYWENLPRLKSIVYDVSPSVWTWDPFPYTTLLPSTIQSDVPRHVRTVSIINDFNYLEEPFPRRELELEREPWPRKAETSNTFLFHTGSMLRVSSTLVSHLTSGVAYTH